jgi:hypothetical protein
LSVPSVFWWPAPGLGDIVWCLWPNKGRGSLPGPKPRPCLVLELDESDLKQPHVLVAYGTSKGVTSLHAGEFAITRVRHPHAYAAAGLSYDTKFDMGQTAWLPYSRLAFDVPHGAPHGQHPKLGTLHISVYLAAQSAHKAAWP